MPLNQFLYSLPPALTAVLFAILALVAFARGRNRPANRLFIVLCVLGGLLNLENLIHLNAPTAPMATFSSRAGYIFHPFLIPCFIQFFHAYLKIEHRSMLVWLAYGYAFVIALFAPGDLIIAGVRKFAFGYASQGGRLYPLMVIGSTLGNLYCLIILIQAIKNEKSGVRKNKLKYLFAGLVTLGLLTCMSLLTRLGYAIYPPGHFGFIPLTIFAAGMFKHDLLDMGLLIRQSLLYSALTALLTMIYALIVIGVQAMFSEVRASDSILFHLALFATITLVFGPLKSRVQSGIDRLFSKGRYKYRQTIKQASRTIATALDYEKITRLLRHTIVDAMQVDSCVLFLAERDGRRFYPFAAVGDASRPAGNSTLSENDPLILIIKKRRRALSRHQLSEKFSAAASRKIGSQMTLLNAELILPMVFQDRLNGFLVLGRKHSGDFFFPEDLDLLETLSHQSAVAIENARAYAALKELNRDLEKKVAARTLALEMALEEKERTQEQLIRSESLAALGQLVAGVAHELNNPLASVTSLLQSTLEDLEQWDGHSPPDEDLIDDLLFAGKELARAKSIVASLLALARQTQTYEETVDMNVVAQDALRVLHNQYKKENLDIVENMADDLPPVQGNFANLGQVVINIVSNALQAVAGKDGQIIVSTGHKHLTRQVVLTCEDNGPGIDTAIRQDVFKPFFTTKPVGQGTGLGLYICHEIIQKHGGRIELLPANPQGTVVKVWLPACG